MIPELAETLLSGGCTVRGRSFTRVVEVVFG